MAAVAAVTWGAYAFFAPEKTVDTFSCLMFEDNSRRGTAAAVKELKVQGKLGDADANLYLGQGYLRGLCYINKSNSEINAHYLIEPDCKKAIQYLTAAMNSGNEDAKRLLEEAQNCGTTLR